MDMNYIEDTFLISMGGKKTKQKKPYQLENLKTEPELQICTF